MVTNDSACSCPNKEELADFFSTPLAHLQIPPDPSYLQLKASHLLIIQDRFLCFIAYSAMEGSKLAMASAFYILVLLGFAGFGAAAIMEDAGGIAPTPTMENGAVALGAPVIVATVVSLLAWFF